MPVRPDPACRLVVALRHQPATHQARTSRAERPSRTHAPDAQARGHQARRLQLPATAGALRRLHRGLQQRASAPGSRRRLPRRRLYTFSARLRGTHPSPITPITIARSGSLDVAASASADARSTSRSPSPAKPWAFDRSRTRSGRSASWSMIWDTSIMKGAGWNPAPIRSYRTKC